ncbi:MAG: DUF4198 domain-containing protein [Gemmatimonadaceae bacterium]|nr:DUF4198 domain-containing protein [Gemmatimonadaceae bacterium]
MRRSKVFVLVAVLVLSGLATATIAFADDFWLVPNAFRVEVGDDVVLRGQTSSQFPTSRTAVAVDRVAEAKLISDRGDVALKGLSVQGRSLVIRDRPAGAGQYAVAVSLHPRSVRESADGFRRYLDAEGAAAARARVEREGLLTGKDSVTRRYAKYAKTLVQVGTGGARAFAQPAGHVIEFVPLRDPTALRAGDTLELRLLFRGEPLAGIPVHADVVALDVDRDALSGSAHAGPGGGAAASAFTPDEGGIVRVPLKRGGMWSIRTIHVTQARVGSGADWDTHWATLVFALDEPPTRQRK